MAHAQVKPPPGLIEIFDVEQGSDEWRRLRLGMVTASVLSSVLASGKDGGDSKMRKKLLYKLAGEILSGEPAEDYSNAYMARGNAMEEAAREHYAFTRGVELTPVGFVRRTLPGGQVVGCSPDSFIGTDGVLEIKTMTPALLVELCETGRFPTEHRAQCHGTLWITGRRWVDLKIFYSGYPESPTFRIERDEIYIREISDAVEVFCWDLANIVARRRHRAGR